MYVVVVCTLKYHFRMLLESVVAVELEVVITIVIATAIIAAITALSRVKVSQSYCDCY